MFCPSFHQHRGMDPSVGFRDHYGWINYWKRARDHRNREKPMDAYLDKLLPREFVFFKSADHFSRYCFRRPSKDNTPTRIYHYQ